MMLFHIAIFFVFFKSEITQSYSFTDLLHTLFHTLKQKMCIRDRSEKGCRAQYQYYFAPSRHAPKDSHYNTSDEMLPANITICWLCKHTNRFACPWFDPDNPRPVDGWTAEKESKLCVNTDNSRHYYVTYKVSHCPKFAPDDPKYYARWRERHKTKNVGECRSTK